LKSSDISSRMMPLSLTPALVLASHLTPNSPPPHSPPPPTPSPPDFKEEIEGTFGMTVATLVLLIIVLVFMVCIVGRLQQLYEKVSTTSSSVSSTADVKKDAGAVNVEMGANAAPAGPGMPVHVTLVHILAIVVGATIALFVGIVLADGTSVIKLKAPKDLDVITNPELRSRGLHHRADELLGPSYGIGLHHDQAGFTWTDVHAGDNLQTLLKNLGTDVVIAALPSVISTDDLKHPVPFLSCDDLQTAGLAACSLGFIALISGVLMIIFHATALTGAVPGKVAKILGGLVWFVLSAGFLVVVCLAVGIFTAEWTCHNDFIPKITVQDHFDWNYGFGFAIIGYIASLLMFFLVLTALDTLDGTPSAPQSQSPVKVVGGTAAGVTLGIVVCVGITMAISGGHNAFEDKKSDANVNECASNKRYHAGPGDSYFSNVPCVRDNIVQTLEQAGANVTEGFRGTLDAGDRVPITSEYKDAGLCPVNVHWHLGAEHLSIGQYDEAGSGPAASSSSSSSGRRLATGPIRQGFQCHHYDASDSKFTSEYNWQHCTNMQVGQTYEIHWPHSAAGACGTQWQYQSPFYDGVFCRHGIITIAPLNTYEKIGVQSQVFTVVNDEAYYKDNLIAGAISGNGWWENVAKYTGSTTGTSRSNNVCSRYTPITWQVDRKCHMISASSFDKLCQDMKAQADDMSTDFYPHGSRMVSAQHLTANNQQTRQ